MSEIIMRDSPQAAHKIFTTAWQSSLGTIFIDENQARYHGCTHEECCICHTRIERRQALCSGCRLAKDKKRHDDAPREIYDGTSLLYSEHLNRYFDNYQDFVEFIQDREFDVPLYSPEDPISLYRLYVCEPNYAYEFEPSYYADISNEDNEIPDAVLTAMDVYNKAIEGIICSWSPVNKVPVFEAKEQ